MAEEKLNVKYRLWFDDEHDVAYLKVFDSLGERDIRELMALTKEIFDGRKHCRILCDLTESSAGLISRGVRRAFKENANIVDYEKITLVGANPSMRMVAGVILTITDTVSKTRFFKTEAEALAWLKE